MHQLQNSPKKYAPDVTWNIHPVYKNRAHTKEANPQKTCGFCTVLKFCFALFYNKCLKCSTMLLPFLIFPSRTTSSTKKKKKGCILQGLGMCNFWTWNLLKGAVDFGPQPWNPSTGITSLGNWYRAWPVYPFKCRSPAQLYLKEIS